jgi:hypothetical protein
VSFLLSAYNCVKSTDEKARAETSLMMAIADLRAIDNAFDALGDKPIAWAEALKTVLQAASRGLRDYIKANKATDCRLTTESGPSINRLP